MSYDDNTSKGKIDIHKFITTIYNPNLNEFIIKVSDEYGMGFEVRESNVVYRRNYRNITSEGAFLDQFRGDLFSKGAALSNFEMDQETFLDALDPLYSFYLRQKGTYLSKKLETMFKSTDQILGTEYFSNKIIKEPEIKTASQSDEKYLNNKWSENQEKQRKTYPGYEPINYPTKNIPFRNEQKPKNKQYTKKIVILTSIIFILILGAYYFKDSTNLSTFEEFTQIQSTNISSTISSLISSFKNINSTSSTSTSNPSSSSSASSPQVKFTLTILGSSGLGSTTINQGVHTYTNGENVQVTAIPAQGWKFDHWTLDNSNSGSANPKTIKMDQYHTLYAVFTQIIINQIDPSIGDYKNYYLGLVKAPGGVEADSYGDFIVLINNRSSRNPTYTQLLGFLSSDKTDQYPYQFVTTILSSYYGTAESNVDLESIKEIIDGTKQPNPPRICADFAERLHNNAEKAGIKCAYVSITVGGIGHALDAFNTTDRGLVYIDDTGVSGNGPANCDKIVSIKIGTSYIPQSLFPEPGWNSIWGNLGTVTSMYITWDGNWNN